MPGALIEPTVNIPPLIEQGDSVEWLDYPFTDVEGASYDSGTYGLVYTIAGANAPLNVTATAKASGWQTNLTPAQTAELGPGLWFWQVRLTATNFALTVARGELTVAADLSTQSAGYSGLSVAEQNLALWKAAFNALSGTGGSAPIASYEVVNRKMTYANIPDILKAINYWQAMVISEQTANSLAQNQGNPRKLYARFPPKFSSGAW